LATVWPPHHISFAPAKHTQRGDQVSEPSAYEQYMLELINAARVKAGIQPLAGNAKLNDAADTHVNWMISNNILSHTGAGGSSSYDRMVSAGFEFGSTRYWGENIAWESLRGAAGYADEVKDLHNWLMNSPGHYANIMNANFTQVGIGFNVGAFQGWQSAVVVEDFAGSSQHFLTGVAYRDSNGDLAYGVGEGLAGLTVTAVGSAGGQFVTQTYGSGGYDLALAAGTYTVTISGSGITPFTQQVTLGSVNVKLDLGLATVAPQPPPPPPASTTITGTSGADVLLGSAGADSITGLNGADRLYGREGSDTLAGGAGNDRFVFDTAPSGSVDLITDFKPKQDIIELSRSDFSSLGPVGTLASDAFWQGNGAHDASDRIIFNRTTGDLIYDPDGTGPALGTVFAHLTVGLNLRSSDFMVVG
jgi:serralysin